MSDPKKPGAPEDDWIPVGGARPRPKTTGNELLDEPAPDAPEKVYGKQERTPPGLISLRVGAIALFLMLALYVFADLRDIETPWQRQFRIGYVLLLVPALGIVWGLIGLAKRGKDDLRRSLLGIVLSLGAFGIAYMTVTAVRAKVAADAAVGADRTQMAPKDLSTWREQKLHRDEPQN